MIKYFNIIISAYKGYFNYLINEVSSFHSHNYFYWLISISLVIWGIEICTPWRKKQAHIRKGFWLDAFYLFFNFFLFSLIAYNAISNIGIELFNDLLASFGISNIVALNLGALPKWGQLLILFIISDFIQWNTHRLLHKTPWLWQFHKLHHSVEEMGFSAHFRFHWMETIVYNTIKFVPLTMIGFGITDFFIIHQVSIIIGHLNHANLGWDYGPLKYILNNPKMHIWHHAKTLPQDRQTGVNFGISLSVWDYLFKTNYIPKNGQNITLGFDGIEKYPTSFFKQLLAPFKKTE